MPTDDERSALPELAPDSEFGPYRIVRLLGRGGMGAVYEAEHRSDGRVVALKLLSVDLDKMDARARFLREGLTAAAINHPNTVYIYGTEEIDGTPAISMELVPGGTLDEKVKARGPLPWTEAVEDILQVIDGLDAALAAGVLHRDVKPSNCFVGANGAVKIGDFGLSKPVEHDEQLKLTQTGVFLGTPVFSSPEQLLGESLDVRSDIYAVGVTFYSLLTGALPYSSGSMMQVVAAVLNGSPTPLAQRRSDLPAGVIAVVQKAMARKVEDRYQTYPEFRADVAALRAVEVAPATLWDRFRAWVVDGTVNFILVSLAVGMTASPEAQPVDWRRVAVSLVIALFVVGIPEGLRGRSVGKWLVGIRVVGPHGGVPGWARGTARVLLLSLTDFATAGMQTLVAGSTRLAAITLISSLLFHLLFLLTARRRNGWRLLHDVLTGTRVVRPQASTAHRRSETRAVTAPRMTGEEPRVGPYVVLGKTHDDGPVLHGWDDGMRRAVWIVPRSAGFAEIASARRSLSRLTRLRWVGGRRSNDEAWDAFEAPIGEPLGARLTRPVSWTSQQDWLEDIATELLAAAQDGTQLSEWSADALWVTPTDRIVFPEGEGAQDGAGTGEQGQCALVGGLLDRVAAAGRRDAPPPRHATLALDGARACTSPAALLSIVQATRGRASKVSRLRRGGLMGATLAPLVVVSLIGWYSIRQAMTSDRAGFVVAGLTSFVSDSLRATQDTVVSANPTTGVKLSRALRSLGFMPSSARDTTTPIDTLRRHRRLAEVYMATVLRDRARDTVITSVFGNTTRDRQRRAAILARNTVVDSTVAREARVLVDSIWKGQVPGNSNLSSLALIPPTVAVFSLFFAALTAIAVGLLVRRGPLLRGFQLEVVTADGALASRWRLLVRNLMSWPSLAASLVALGLAQVASTPALARTIVGCVVFTLVWWVLAIVISWRTPSRGLAERASGTYLVLE